MICPAAGPPTDVTLAAGAALGLVFGLLAGTCAFVIAYFIFFFVATLILPQVFRAAGE